MNESQNNTLEMINWLSKQKVIYMNTNSWVKTPDLYYLYRNKNSAWINDSLNNLKTLLNHFINKNNNTKLPTQSFSNVKPIIVDDNEFIYLCLIKNKYSQKTNLKMIFTNHLNKLSLPKKMKHFLNQNPDNYLKIVSEKNNSYRLETILWIMPKMHNVLLLNSYNVNTAYQFNKQIYEIYKKALNI